MAAKALFAFVLCAIPVSATAEPSEPLGQLVDSRNFGYSFGYAPSIVREDGRYHMLYCSSGTGPLEWDIIRYVSSIDGISWTDPQAVLRVSGGITERAACDPSVVRFDAGDGPFYYLFYSGNVPGYETVMLVARSQSIKGPFAKYTRRGTWEVSAHDPAVIMYPTRAVPEGAMRYGAGQQTVLAVDGMLYSWHMDDTDTGAARIYFSSTTDPKSWPDLKVTNVESVSVDVAYDRKHRLFRLFSVEPHHGQNSHLLVRTSVGGAIWSPPRILVGSTNFPGFSHNVGVSRDRSGALSSQRPLFVYGTPYDEDPRYENITCDNPGAIVPHCWGHWNLYGHRVDMDSGSFDSTIYELITQ